MPNRALDGAGTRTVGGNSRDQVKRDDGGGHIESRVKKRSLMIGGHRTSVSLEDVFWNELRAIAQERHVHLSQLADSIDRDRHHGNLSSAIRLFVFETRCTRAGDIQNKLQRAGATAPRA